MLYNLKWLAARAVYEIFVSWIGCLNLYRNVVLRERPGRDYHPITAMNSGLRITTEPMFPYTLANGKDLFRFIWEYCIGLQIWNISADDSSGCNILGEAYSETLQEPTLLEEWSNVGCQWEEQSRFPTDECLPYSAYAKISH